MESAAGGGLLGWETELPQIKQNPLRGKQKIYRSTTEELAHQGRASNQTTQGHHCQYRAVSAVPAPLSVQASIMFMIIPHALQVDVHVCEE